MASAPDVAAPPDADSTPMVDGDSQTPDVGPACRGGTIELGSCYLFLTTPAMQVEAKASCAEAGAHLVFTWSNGEPTPYRNWNSGQPNDDNSCVTILPNATGGWGDRPCAEDGYRYAAVCERDL